MELFTKEIEKRAEEQCNLGSNLKNQNAVAKFFNPNGAGTWYLINKEKNSDYCWGICHIFEWEIGSFLKSDLENFRGKFGLGIERDLHFEEVNAEELWSELLKR